MPVDDDDLDALIALNGQRANKECAVHYGLRMLPPDTRAKMVAALANPAAPVDKLREAFIARGVDVPTMAIQRHRRPPGRGCKCHECDCGECV